MKRIIMSMLVLTMMSYCVVSSMAATEDWDVDRNQYHAQLIIGATDNVTHEAYYSNVLEIPIYTDNISLVIRSGTTSDITVNNSVSGSISNATFDIGIFDSKEMADFYLTNASTIGYPPKYAIPIGDSAIVYKALNGSEKITEYGSYQIPNMNSTGGTANLVIWASATVADATTFNAVGLIFDVYFSKTR